MHTLTIHKDTARDIAKARRAIAATDMEKAAAALEPWQRRRCALAHDSRFDPNLATLRITGAADLILPIRCDILAKWTAAHQDAERFDMQIDDNLSVTIRANGSTLKLLAPKTTQPVDLNASRLVGSAPVSIAGSVLPLVARMAAEFGSCELLPDFDVKSACLTARSLRAAKADAKAAGERAREVRAQQHAWCEYTAARALLTPENIHKAAKQTRSLRRLRKWTRALKPIVEALPCPLTLDQYRELDPLSSETIYAYAHRYGLYLLAKKRHDTYAPRSYYASSKERPKRAEEMQRAADAARHALMSGLDEHASAFGCGAHGHSYGASGVTIHAYPSQAVAAISAAKKTLRIYRAAIADTFRDGAS